MFFMILFQYFLKASHIVNSRMFSKTITHYFLCSVMDNRYYWGMVLVRKIICLMQWTKYFIFLPMFAYWLLYLLLNQQFFYDKTLLKPGAYHLICLYFEYPQNKYFCELKIFSPINRLKTERSLHSWKKKMKIFLEWPSFFKVIGWSSVFWNLYRLLKLIPPERYGYFTFKLSSTQTFL